MAISNRLRYTNSDITNLRKIIDEEFSRNFLQQKIEENNKLIEKVNEKYGTNYVPYNHNNNNIIYG
jgi:hypothetical protein